MNEDELLERITTDPAVFGGKPLIRGMRIAVEHVLGMLAGGDTPGGCSGNTHSWNRPTSRLVWLTRTGHWPANRFRTGSQEPRHREIPAGCMRFVAHPYKNGPSLHASALNSSPRIQYLRGHLDRSNKNPQGNKHGKKLELLSVDLSRG